MTGVTMSHVGSLMCSPACLREWEMKYTRKILGKDFLEGEGEGDARD